MKIEERIELLENELKRLKAQSRKELPWTSISRKVNNSLEEAIGDRFKEVQVKSALSCIIAKAYNVSNVQKLSEDECQEALPLIDEILEFIRFNRQSREN